MTYKEAKNLKAGDKVKQKMHGYIMTVIKTEDYPVLYRHPVIFVHCETESGGIMKHKHTEVDKFCLNK